MARSPRKGLDYFPLDVTFFEDKKIKILRSRCGDESILLYLRLLCELYRGEGYYLVADADFFELLAVELAMEEDALTRCIFAMTDKGLFDHTLLEERHILTSHAIQSQYQEMIRSRAYKHAVRVEESLWLLSPEETKEYIVYCSDESNGTMVEQSHKEKKKERETEKETENQNKDGVAVRRFLTSVVDQYHRICTGWPRVNELPYMTELLLRSAYYQGYQVFDFARTFHGMDVSPPMLEDGTTAGFSWIILHFKEWGRVGKT